MPEIPAIDELTVTLAHYLVVSGIVFGIGVVVALAKRNAVAVLMGVELMLNAVNLTILAFSRFSSALILPQSAETSSGLRSLVSPKTCG